MRSSKKSQTFTHSTRPQNAQQQAKAARNNQFRRNRTPVVPALFPRGPEIKSIDTSIVTAAPGGAPLAINSTGSIIPLNVIAIGTGFWNRIGSRVELKSVDFEMQLNRINQTVTSTTDLFRLMIVYDRQTNGANPAISDILQDTDNAGTNTTNAECGVNLNNRDRFSVIVDKRIMLPAATNTAGVLTNVWPNSYGGIEGTGNGIGRIREYRKLRGLATMFKSSTPSVADITTGGLFLITFANLAAGGENFNGSGWSARVRYSDN